MYGTTPSWRRTSAAASAPPTGQSSPGRPSTTLSTAPPVRARMGVRDFLAALSVCALVFCSTLPIAVPFLLFQSVPLAMRVSNGFALAQLFIAGALYARAVGGRSWLIGLTMVVLGSALVAMTIALGG